VRIVRILFVHGKPCDHRAYDLFSPKYDVRNPSRSSVRFAPCSTVPLSKSTDLILFSPWDLKARTWIFVISEISKNASFPAGFSDPIEAEALASGGEFIGGVGMIQVRTVGVNLERNSLRFSPGGVIYREPGWYVASSNIALDWCH